MSEFDSTCEKRTSPTRKFIVFIVLLAMVVLASIKWSYAVGAIVVCSIVATMISLAVLKNKLIKYITNLENCCGNSDEFTLIEDKHATPKNPQSVQKAIECLRNRGFKEAGVYKIWQDEDSHVFGEVDEARSIFASIFDFQSESDNVILDLTTYYRDGTAYICTNTTESLLVNPLSGNILIRHGGASPAELVGEFLKGRPDKPMLSAKAEEFAPRLEQYHRETMKWMGQRREYLENIDGRLREEFLLQGNWPAIEWERKKHRIIIVHTEMDASEIAQRFLSCLESEDEDGGHDVAIQVEKIAVSLPPLAAFERMTREFCEDLPPEKIMEMQSPMKADVYYFPEGSDGGEEGEEADGELLAAYEF